MKRVAVSSIKRFFCKSWGIIWLPLTRVTPHGVRRCHEVTEETAAVSGWRAQRD